MTRGKGQADWMLPSYMGACLLLGGASAAGVLANFVLQLCGGVAIAFALWAGKADRRADGSAGLLGLAAALALIPLVQLVPLPPGLWQMLPGRAEVAEADMMWGRAFVRPLSLQPGLTLSFVAGLLPPLAALLLTLRASPRSRRAAILIVIAASCASALIGALQLLGGPQSPLYFYAITNNNASVGLFANSNHLSALLLAALLFAAGLPYRSVAPRDAGRWQALRLGLALFLTAGVLLNRSLAGILLLGPALLFWTARQPGPRAWLRHGHRLAWVGAGCALVTITAAGLAVQSPAFRAQMAGLTDPAERMAFLDNTMTLAGDMFPAGSGMGTFRALYAGSEDPDAVTTVFVNHAHNDHAEFLLEAGIAAPLLLAAFLIWLARRVRTFRVGERRNGESEAVAIIVLVALHSGVDYPLRTAAVAAIAAFCCGLLVQDGGATPSEVSRSR